MQRTIEKDLRAWKESSNRMPLLLRGARQVGKSFTVDKFGRENFEKIVTINFEQYPFYIKAFDELDPKKIISLLSLLSSVSIDPGRTLLFLDEIQLCPQAILALRYFKEQMPSLHIIGAGSLLEFTLDDPSFRMPVGRVQSLFMKPLSFYEFLDALGKETLRKHLEEVSLERPPSEIIHQQLLSLVRDYFNIGGMPAVVSEYAAGRDLSECQNIQTNLLTTYRNDFGKYAKITQHKYLQLMFERAPGLIAQWFKYSKIDPDIPSRDLKNALDKLKDAGLIYQIFATQASQLPLIASSNLKKFKLLFLDVGLVKRASRIDLETLFDEDIMLINQGALVEQFVGQELIAYSNPDEAPQLFFWIREEKTSSAEVDFITNVGAKIIPVEVKAGSTGRLKSLKIVMSEKKWPLGIRVSQTPLSYENNILSLPLYMIGELARFAGSVSRS
jgi:predicted AAA+ superfamily ATPase